MTTDPLREFSKTGRLWLRGALSSAGLSTLRALAGLGGRPGARLAADSPLFTAIAQASFFGEINHIWPGMRPVRVVSFDKTAGVNWGVPWHQDRIIAVKDRHDLPGFTNWSRKGDA